ncbi:MAG: MATE family efflux transporter [Bacteroidales bacterium]|nr:MATE family efflux transporter [Bacteroidales bacterium]
MNREILRIAVPAIVTNVTIPLLGLLDTAIAGHLDGGSGATYIGAVAVGAMMFNLIYWNFGFLRMGTSGLTAQAFGRGDKAEAGRVLQHATALGLLIALAIIALQWPLQWITLLAIGPSEEVRSLALTYFYIGVWGAPPTLMMMGIKGWMLGMQDSRRPMVISIGVNVLNIALSVVAVFGLGMGFKGIIVGTVVAEWIGLAYSTWLLRRHYTHYIKGINLAQALRFEGAGRFFKVNSHIFARSTMMMLQALFFTAAGARSGDMTLAVNTLILQMAILFSYFMDGIAFAGEAVAGKYCGRGDVASEHSCVRHLFGWAAVLTAATALLYAIFPQEIFSLLTNDGSVVEHALHYRWWCAAVPVAGMAAYVWDGVFIGLTRTREMMLAVGIALAAFLLAYYLLPTTMGNHALWLAYAIFLATRSMIQTVQYIYTKD